VNTFILPCLYPADSPGKGRGVFTTLTLEADKVVECSPVIVMDAEARKLLDQTLLHDYIFEWQAEGRNDCCLALGYLSVYNHSFTSNCEYFMDYDTNTMSIKTIRPISAGEELTINYNGDWDNQSPLWFSIESQT
jgi:uncharacterized protein